MSALSVALVNPSWTLDTAGTDGPLIDQMRDNCGFVVQAIDWVCRKLGFDLIGAILDPIAGDYDAVDAMASNWAVLGQGLGQIGDNFDSLAGAAPSIWTGEAATAATGRLTDFGQGFADQAEASGLIATAMQDMLVATKAVVELIADLLSMVDDLALALMCSALKLAKEIATGGATVRKIVSLVNQAISAIRTLENVVPPLLQACATMSKMMKALDIVFLMANVSANSHTGSQADDVAHAGFGDG